MFWWITGELVDVDSVNGRYEGCLTALLFVEIRNVKWVRSW